MNPQKELFPRSSEESMERVRNSLAAIVEKRGKALDSASDKLAKAENLLDEFDAARQSEKAVLARLVDPQTGELREDAAAARPSHEDAAAGIVQDAVEALDGTEFVDDRGEVTKVRAWAGGIDDEPGQDEAT